MRSGEKSQSEEVFREKIRRNDMAKLITLICGQRFSIDNELLRGREFIVTDTQYQEAGSDIIQVLCVDVDSGDTFRFEDTIDVVLK